MTRIDSFSEKEFLRNGERVPRSREAVRISEKRINLRHQTNSRVMPFELHLDELLINGVKPADINSAITALNEIVMPFKSGGGGVSPKWGGITGDIENQSDLMTLLTDNTYLDRFYVGNERFISDEYGVTIQVWDSEVSWKNRVSIFAEDIYLNSSYFEIGSGYFYVHCPSYRFELDSYYGLIFSGNSTDINGLCIYQSYLGYYGDISFNGLWSYYGDFYFDGTLNVNYINSNGSGTIYIQPGIDVYNNSYFENYLGVYGSLEVFGHTFCNGGMTSNDTTYLSGDTFIFGNLKVTGEAINLSSESSVFRINGYYVDLAFENFGEVAFGGQVRFSEDVIFLEDVTIKTDPTAPQHAATKKYVDTLISQLKAANGLV